MTNSAAKSRRVGVIGCIVGLLALVAAVLPHWIVPAIFPPAPFEQVKTDPPPKLKDRLIGVVMGTRPQSNSVEHQVKVRNQGTGDRLNDAFSTAAVSLALLAIVLAVLALIFREERLFAGVSAVLGTVALGIEIVYVLAPFVWFFIMGILLLSWFIS
jgi:predicted membrane protein